jgi:pyrroline-5-carboxylate reductase
MRLLMVGAGNMGGAMLRCWLDSGMAPADVTVVSPSGRAMPDGVRVVPAIPDAADATFDAILLGLKPQQLAMVRDGALAGHAPPLLISILAGVEAATLATLCDAGAVVRAMPNLPVAIGKGVVALHSSAADAAARESLTALMQPLGLALAPLEGAAIMAADADATPAVLADRVASPGGSTRQGLNVLDRDDALVALLTETLAASARRNREMAAAAR